jgi:hypothetical protein
MWLFRWAVWAGRYTFPGYYGPHGEYPQEILKEQAGFYKQYGKAWNKCA